MSNFQPTVGRNVQYLGANGFAFAALVTGTYSDGSADLVVFSKSTGATFKDKVRQYVVSDRPSSNVDVYLLTWQGR